MINGPVIIVNEIHFFCDHVILKVIMEVGSINPKNNEKELVSRKWIHN